MKNSKILKNVFLVALLVALVFVFQSCSADFWDGFVDGYNYTRQYR